MVREVLNVFIDLFLSGLSALVEAFLFFAVLFLLVYATNQGGEPWVFIGWPLSTAALFFPPLWFLGSWFFKFRRRQSRRVEQASAPVNVGS